MAQNLVSCFIFCLMLLSIIGWSSSHDLNSPKTDSVMHQDKNTNYTKILNFWKKHKEEFIFHGDHKEVVLVMGNTGSGKTTLVSALIGRKLEVIKPKSYYLIVDKENRIGTGVSSKTLIPEVMVDNERNITFVDCSGFRDNRNVEYEISSLYFQNILMNQVEKIKLILVINHDSLTINGNKNDFDNLLENVGEFAKNISKFHSGIALVATKVENIFDVDDDGTAILMNDDQSVLNDIADYLQKKRETYLNKSSNFKKYQLFVHLIDILLEKNNNLYSKITIFRQPTRKGLLENDSMIKNEITAIGRMIIENLRYVEKQKDDFGFALSPSSKATVDQIIDDIIKHALTNRLHKIGNEMYTHYLQMEKQYSDIEILCEKLSNASNLISEVKNVNEPEKLFEGFLNVANTLNIPISLTNLDIISEDIKTLRFFTTVSNNNEDINIILLKKEMQYNIDTMVNLTNFYKFLNDLQDKLSTYNSQNWTSDPRIENVSVSCITSKHNVVQDIPNLEIITAAIGSHEYYKKIETFTLNRFQLKHLAAVFSAFERKLEFSCTSSGPMIVKGYNIRISDVIGKHCWAQAKIIQIFALNKVFIDQTINKTGEEVQLFIFAPTWEVVGGPKIILDGKAGERHENAFAKSASSNSENGTNGLPGRSGGPAGNFFGLGKRFININFLEIHANGGEGSPGQHGGNGADGIQGEEFDQSFFNDHPDWRQLNKYLSDHQFYSQKFKDQDTPFFDADLWHGAIVGKEATKPTDGGDGGASGKAGYPGEIIINGLGKSVNVITSKNPGSTGLAGQGGRGGKETSNGRIIFYDKWTSTILQITYYENIVWVDGLKVPAGKNGTAGNNTKNQDNPKTPTIMNLYPIINSFKNFVRMNLFENIRESELRTFINELEHDNQIKAQYNTYAFVEELKELENQCPELRNKIDLVPFYNSFLTRINEYFKSENIIENKKVLSYIYTAALTKVFLLKKTRKGQTVVNLPKYLETIENSIKIIDQAYHFQVVQRYQDDFKNSLNKKIQEANNFIQNTIEPEIDKLWNESENQIKAIIDEINENKNETKKRLEATIQEKIKFHSIMLERAGLLSLKLFGFFLSFAGPIGAGLGVAATSATTLVEGVTLDTTSSLGQNRIYTLDPNLKLISRVTETYNNKYKLASDKLNAAMAKLEEYEKELSQSDKDRKTKIKKLKTQFQEAIVRPTKGVSESFQKIKDVEEITKKMYTITNSEKDILEKKKEEEKNVKDLKKETKYEKSLRLLNDVQAILNGAEIVYSFTRKFENDKGIIRKINDEISECNQQLKILEQMENQVYNIITPDIRQIEQTINTIKNSINGSSHVQLDVTKWQVQTTLKDVKLLLQKFTRKMSFELQSNLQRYIEKIDEGFSILIDIYNRIDAYSDSVKQAEYIARIESPTMIDIHVNDTELSKAVNDLKLTIHSNILTEKYEIALFAFKQHYFPFAAHFLQRFQLPKSMQFDDTETLKSNIINIINDMKIYIADSESTIRIYSEYIHRKKIFNSNIIGSSPFYVWQHDSIKNEVQQLLNGSEIILKADIFKGLFLNAIKYSDIGINLKLKNDSLQSSLTSVLKNFKLTMKMIGNNYYRCGEQYYFISFDDSITISYILNQDKEGNWYDPNEIYTLIHNSHTFLSPYGMWSIKLESVNNRVSFDHLNIYANETIDIELVGQGYYIDQKADFNFEVCNGYLNTFYDVENTVKVLSYDVE